MKQIKFICAAIYFFAIAGCSTGKHIAQSSAASAQLTTSGAAWAALWQQHAAEYKALCFQAYNMARVRIDEYALLPHEKPLAVVTDIDETVLDNSPYSVHQALKGLGYDDSSWMEWTAKIDCDTVPGALSFLQYAASKNIEVFYVTNRLQTERDATVSNLRKWNFPNADTNHVLLKTITSSKDERRNAVAANHTILLFLGDNLGDFSGIFDHKTDEQRSELAVNNAAEFGRHFIVLPNVMYGEWLNALINYQYRQTQQQQSDVLIKQMKNY
jgi:5'-nucleotidase (lipoprotein e(P4) family)